MPTSDNHSAWPGGITKVLLKNQGQLLQAIYTVLQLCHFEFLLTIDNRVNLLLLSLTKHTNFLPLFDHT